MSHDATSNSWKCYDDLPLKIRELADKNFQLLKSNPRHRSLHLKKTSRFWSVRVGKNYRSVYLIVKFCHFLAGYFFASLERVYYRAFTGQNNKNVY